MRFQFFAPTHKSRQTGLYSQRRSSGHITPIAGLLALAAVFFAHTPAHSQSSALVNRGDAAVTAFSGTKTDADVPTDVHPLDVTFINPEAASLRVLDLSNLGGPPAGQLAETTTKLTVPASQIGQVFGIALDSPDDAIAPNIFAAATSLYGLQIVGKRNGKRVRLVNGEPGARWMPGQFATRNGGGPGTIWKIDGKTGAVSLFTTVKSGASDNAGPGLGALAYDFVTHQLYVPNLETGFIHRIDKDGKDLGIFDHGTSARPKADFEAIAYDPSKRMSIEDGSFHIEKPSTWGFTDMRRLVVAVAIQDDRLYYSVAHGPQVWSVGLDSKGGFVEDARLEIDLADAPKTSMITGIAFDGAGEIYLTQRGELKGSYDFRTFANPDNATVVHVSWNDEDESWSQDSDEFPIGLKSPHRATNGGVALGYGYDDNGSIKTQSCNAVLWTTGDHLGARAGTDSKVVSGLQGISKSLGQPRTPWQPRSGTTALQGDFDRSELTELSPPTDIWLIDLDGQSKGTDAFGNVGALAIYSPHCEPEESSDRPDPVDVPDPEIAWPGPGPDGVFPGWPPGGIPPIGFPGLEITKACAPAAFGGVIQCTITIKNTGTLPFLAPIPVSDATTITAGPGAGGAMSIASVTPDGADWTCTPTPTMNLTCALPPQGLLPGVSRSFTVDIDTSNMIANGNVGFNNCASFGAPYWGIACDHAGTDITVKKTANPGCIAGANCTYNLEVTNNSPTPFNGQLQLTDQMFLGAIGGPLNAPIVAIAGDLGCAGGNPAGIPFSCVSTMSLAANETRSIAITATMPAAPPNYWARNCFAATNPGLIPGDLANAMPPGGGSLGSGGALSCAWMQVGVPPPHANLKIQKTAQACGKIPGDENTVKCDYTISITNTGPSDFNTPITFDETVDPAATLVLNDPAWACAGGPPTYTCNSAAAVTIAANETIEIPVSVTTPKNVVEANICYVPNTVTLTAPPVNAVTNYLGADDTASVDGDAFLLEFDANGAAIILCDPTNLKTTKTSKGPCEKAGSGWSCDYEIIVENTGPDPYKGRIELIDVSSVAPTDVTISGTPGWSRTPGVGHDVYRLGKRTLQKGESVTLNLTVNIPDGPNCSLTNTAHMTFPILKRHNGDTTDDTGIATSIIPRPECKRAPACEPEAGEILTSSGSCACKPGATREKDGTCKDPTRDPEPTPIDDPKQPDPPAKTCPDGYPIPRNGVCPCPDDKIWSTTSNRCINDDDDPPGDTVLPDPGGPVVPLCRLLPGQIRTSDNRCVCANGGSWNSKTYCNPRPCRLRAGQIRTSDNRCVCANGRSWNSETYCERRTPSCTPRRGEVIINGKCKCANGRTWNAKTHCNKPPKVCANGDLYLAAPGVCCLIGQVYSHGKCQRPPPTCTKPRFENRYGICTCGPNKTYIARNNTCVRKTDPAKECRHKGWNWTGKKCVPPTSTCKKPRYKNKNGKCTCGPNKTYIARNNTCVRKTDPAKECRHKGWNWTGYECVRPNNPAKDCKAKGWTWTGKKCIRPLSPAQKCKIKGWKWTGRSCVKPQSPAQQCKAKGWKWTGKKCVKPQSQAQKCKAKGWKWTGKKCIRRVKPCPKGWTGPGQPNCKLIKIYKKPPPKKIYIPNPTYRPGRINMRRKRPRRRIN